MKIQGVLMFVGAAGSPKSIYGSKKERMPR